MKNEIEVKFKEPVNGFWDYGPKQTLVFSADSNFIRKGKMKWGSWEGNFWFWCGCGRSEREAISIAIRKLKRFTRKSNPEIKVLN